MLKKVAAEPNKMVTQCKKAAATDSFFVYKMLENNEIACYKSLESNVTSLNVLFCPNPNISSLLSCMIKKQKHNIVTFEKPKATHLLAYLFKK